jgi:hypothetical protein
MNRFRRLGFIEYNGGLHVNDSLLRVILHELIEDKRGPQTAVIRIFAYGCKRLVIEPSVLVRARKGTNFGELQLAPSNDS